jgi:hypothetical protein
VAGVIVLLISSVNELDKLRQTINRHNANVDFFDI